MKVENEFKYKMGLFDEIPVGECFMHTNPYTNQNSLYMKIDGYYDYESCDNWNAVLLSSGELNQFEDDDVVIPVSTTIIVESPE